MGGQHRDGERAAVPDEVAEQEALVAEPEPDPAFLEADLCEGSRLGRPRRP